MLKKLEDYKSTLELIMKNLAKLDYVRAADNIDKLIRDADYIIRHKELEVVEQHRLENVKQEYGKKGLSWSLGDDNFTCILIKVYDIETVVLKNVYLKIHAGDVFFRYDAENKQWVVDDREFYSYSF